MCILMVLHQQIRGYPIVLAANRDEYLDRPTQGPGLLRRSPFAWGGRDKRAGGTWLGVNEFGLVVGLTNRRMRTDQKNDPSRRSRGLLCLDVLQCRSADEAASYLIHQSPGQYNPFNLLAIDSEAVYWLQYEDSVHIHALEPGLYILANGNINDFETVRIHRARHLLASSTEPAAFSVIASLLKRVCRDHEEGVHDRDTVCMHRLQENYGTVSSTILALTPDLHGSLYLYADGAPCKSPYNDYSFLLEEVYR